MKKKLQRNKMKANKNIKNQEANTQTVMHPQTMMHPQTP